MSPVKYELSFYITEDDILHRPRRENLKSYKPIYSFIFSLRLTHLAIELEVSALFDTIMNQFRLPDHSTTSFQSRDLCGSLIRRHSTKQNC
jgi:hypothetical protein